MKKFVILFLMTSLVLSCGQGKKESSTGQAGELQSITVIDFLNDAGAYVEKPVLIRGTVVHVCRHGGQRMFIIDENGEERVRITTGEDIPEFDIELEGEEVEVSGIVRELIIDETYLAEWEAEVLEGSKIERGEGHEGGVGHGDHHGDVIDPGEAAQPAEGEDELESQLDRIQSVREEIAQSGEDHLSDFWIETIAFRVLKDQQ
jgi:hypothetical protein